METKYLKHLSHEAFRTIHWKNTGMVGSFGEVSHFDAYNTIFLKICTIFKSSRLNVHINVFEYGGKILSMLRPIGDCKSRSSN